MVNGFITERLIYKDQLAPIAKLDADGNVLEEYVYALGVNLPDYIRKDGVNYRVVKDHLGSTRMVVNASTGEVVKEIRYSEFGEITEETGTFDTIFGFAGGLQDRDTGLIHFGARWYDPEVGRWIKKDPIMFDGGLNHYAYCDGDPVNFVDVNGQFRFLSEKQLNAEFSDVKDEYLALQNYLITRFKSRLESEGGKRYDAYEILFNTSKSNVNKIFKPNAGPLISLTQGNEESGRYDSGTIYVNKGLLKDWGKTKDSTMYILIEHELSHHFDELYNDLKRQKEFVSSVCSKYWVENGDISCIFRPGHEKGTQMYKYYYNKYEAGNQYEQAVYKKILFNN